SARGAARAAGYSSRGVSNIADLNMKKPAIRAEIEERQAALAITAGLTAAEVLADLVRIADDAEAERQYGAAVRAWELIGKHLGMFGERKANVSVDASWAHLAALEAIRARNALVGGNPCGAFSPTPILNTQKSGTNQ